MTYYDIFRKDTENYLNKRIPKIERILGYSFKNKNLLKQAFLKHPIKVEDIMICNDSLEFIGDRVLGVLIPRIYSRELLVNKDNFFDLPSSDLMTNYYQKHSSNRAWCEIIQQKNNTYIRETLRMHNCLIKQATENKYCKVWADLFEALFGALAIDSDYDFSVLEKSFINLKFKNIDGLLNACESELKIKNLKKKELLS